MSLTTRSSFYYGIEIDETNNKIDFDEGGDAIVATIESGAFSFQEFCTQIATALNDAGSEDYTVTIDRSTRKITVAATGTFRFLGNSGLSKGVTALSEMGFALTDGTLATSVTGGSAIGSVFSPQFILQDHISTDNFRRAAFASVNKSASGKVQVQKFGTEKFMQCNIKYITNIVQPAGGIIESDINAVEDAQTFLQWMTEKKPAEFMADRDDVSTYQEFILESTDDSQDGTGYKLRELYDKGLPNYFETGKLIFRLQE